MLDGNMRGLPKEAPPRSHLEFVKSTSVWDPASNTITTPTELGPDDVIFFAVGVDGAQAGHIPGATQDGAGTVNIVNTMVACTSTTDQASMIALIRRLEGASWPTSLNLNQNVSTFDSGVAAAFRPSKGFLGITQMNWRHQPGSVNSFTVTPPTNIGPRPGGIAVYAVEMDAGGAGPNTPASQNGWQFIHSGGILVFGYHLLDPSQIITPGSFTISSSRTDTWSGCLAYIV